MQSYISHATKINKVNNKVITKAQCALKKEQCFSLTVIIENVVYQLMLRNNISKVTFQHF